MGVNIGVLTVPIAIAQEISDKMIAGGIKAIWNFTPSVLGSRKYCSAEYITICSFGCDVQTV